MKNKVPIGIMGMGYVGLVIAACLVKLGYQITVFDIDEKKVKAINEKRSPIFEPGIDEILKKTPVKATMNPLDLADTSIIFICVNTASKTDGAISLDAIKKAAEQIAGMLKVKKDYCTIVIKSTVIPGTTQEVILPILENSGKKVGQDFGICMSPEFIREGKGIRDFMQPDRIIIGEYDEKSGDELHDLFRDFKAPILRVNLATAEMIKYASNTFLATKLSFINEIGNICKRLGIDIYQVAQGMGYDERIGNQFLNAGVGFGGSCFPKDLKALIIQARELGYQPKLLEEVKKVNDRQILKIIELLKKYTSLKNRHIGLLGLSFKPETDDIKDSVAILITQTLLKERAIVMAYDPRAMQNFKKLFPQISYGNPDEILKCDAVLILTEWEEFSRLDYSKTKIVIDGRRVLKAKEALIYEGICW
jgi:UDPglucose 6-dehydrogenase